MYTLARTHADETSPKRFPLVAFLMGAAVTIVVLVTVSWLLLQFGNAPFTPLEMLSARRELQWRASFALVLLLFIILVVVAVFMHRARRTALSNNTALQVELRQHSSYVQLLQTIAIAANEATSIEAAMQYAIDEVCRQVGWPLGHVYFIAQDGSRLALPSALWHSEDAERFRPFVEQTSHMRFTAGVGLIGAVMQEGRPIWLSNVTADEARARFPRAAAAREAGIKAAFAFPVQSGTQLEAVLEFFGTDAMEPNEGLLEVMSHVGTQLGHVVARKRAEEALRKSSSLLNQVFETVAAGIYIVDASGRMTFVNRGLEQILGMSRAEIAERAFNDPAWQITTLDGKPFPDEAQPFSIIMRTGKPVYGVEQKLTRADGTHIIVSINAAPLLDDQGNVVGEVASLDDITTRRNAARELDEERNLLRSVIDNLPYDIFIKDLDGRFMINNHTHARSLGVSSPAEALGKTSYDFFPQKIAHQQWQDDQFIIQTGQPILNRERLGRTVGGDEHWVLTSKVPLYDTSWNIKGVLGISQDITTRKRMETDLRKSLSTNRALLSAIPDLMFRIRTDGLILDFSGGKNWELGLSAEEIINKSIYLVIPHRIAKQAMTLVHAALKGGEMQRLECQLTQNGKVHDYEARIVPCGEAEVLAMVRDISERKASDRIKNEFVATVSHELRTPLTSIRGSLGLIAGGVAGELPPQARTMLEIAYKNSERLVRLINDILDVEKIESGKLVFQLKPLELMPFIAQALEANRAYAEQYDVQLELCAQLAGLMVKADSDRLMQVMSNLLSNAAKFSPPCGVVRVLVQRRDHCVRIAIHDDGPGVPAEFRARIFEKFAQADASDTRQKGGTGLGLSISKAIVERHGGRIDFESEPGAGTTFFFELPILHMAMPAALPPARMDGTPILICEDDPDIANLLSLMLAQHGFRAQIAYSAAEARERLAHETYAAMTLDLVLPDLDGASFIRELRQQERTRQLPIVVVSAQAEEGRQRLNGDAFLVVDWLSKPIHQSRLVSAVQAATRATASGRTRILHIEDDVDVLQVVRLILKDLADVDHALDTRAAIRMLGAEAYDLIILDLSLADESGLDLLPHTHAPGRMPVPVVIFSGQEVSHETASRVAATLVKARTSNQELFETIQALLQVHGTAAAPAGPVYRGEPVSPRPLREEVYA